MLSPILPPITVDLRRTDVRDAHRPGLYTRAHLMLDTYIQAPLHCTVYYGLDIYTRIVFCVLPRFSVPSQSTSHLRICISLQCHHPSGKSSLQGSAAHSNCNSSSYTPHTSASRPVSACACIHNSLYPGPLAVPQSSTLQQRVGTSHPIWYVPI